VANDTGHLQLGVVDGAMGVFEGNQIVLDTGWEGLAPHQGWESKRVFRDPDAAHTGASCIASANMLGFGGDNFSDSSGAAPKVIGEIFKVRQLVMDCLGEPDAGAVTVTKCQL